MKKISEVMRTDSPVLSPSQSVAEAARLMKKHSAWGLAVLDEGRIVGILTDGDLLDEFYLNVSARSRDDEEALAKRAGEFLEMRVKEVMRIHPRIISENSGVEEAAETIKTMGIKRLIVVDAKGKYAGMVERISVINAILD